VAEHRDEKQQDADYSERGSNHYAGQTHSQALKRMKTHKAVFVVGLEQKENDRREKEVCQSASQRLSQPAHGASCALVRTHGAAAARTVCSSLGH
jgi:hypothetical protein